MTNHPNRTIIRSTARNAFPGDTARIMTGAHTDMDGIEWPDGTIYQPLFSGANNVLNATAQTISVDGRQVQFASRRLAKPQSYRGQTRRPE